MAQRNVKASLSEERTALFIEVLEVCIHTILCVRGVYPKGAFARQLAFDVAVYMSRHQELSEFISNLLLKAKPLLDASVIERLSLCIFAANTIIERYDFEVHLLQPFPTENDQDGIADAVQDTEYQIRALLLRLSTLDTQLPPLPTNTTFTLVLHTRDNDQVNRFLTIQDCGWGVDASLAGDSVVEDAVTSSASSNLIFPVKRVDTPLVNFSLNVQTRSASVRGGAGSENNSVAFLHDPGLTPLSS